MLRVESVHIPNKNLKFIHVVLVFLVDPFLNPANELLFFLKSITEESYSFWDHSLQLDLDLTTICLMIEVTTALKKVTFSHHCSIPLVT